MTFPLILRKPRVLFGAVAAFLVGMVLAWFALTEIVYQVAVVDIAPRIAPPPQRILPLKILQVGWVSQRESGKMRLRPAMLGWIPVAFFAPGMSGSPMDEAWNSAGFSTSERAGRMFFRRDSLVHWHSLRSHKERLMATIWITRHWTAEQAVTGLVEKSYYGCSMYDLDTASRAYLGKPVDSLDLPQMVAIMAYGRNPERYRKDSVAFEAAFSSLQDRVIENFPELASEKGAMPRFLVNACPRRPMDSLQEP